MQTHAFILNVGCESNQGSRKEWLESELAYKYNSMVTEQKPGPTL